MNKKNSSLKKEPARAPKIEIDKLSAKKSIKVFNKMVTNIKFPH